MTLTVTAEPMGVSDVLECTAYRTHPVTSRLKMKRRKKTMTLVCQIMNALETLQTYF